MNGQETKKPFYKTFWFYVIVIPLFLYVVGKYTPENNKPSTISEKPTSRLERSERRPLPHFKILEWHTEKRLLETTYVIGEVKNTGSIDAGVELQAIVRDKDGKIIDSCSFWPASIKNIPAGTTWPIKYGVTDKSNIGKISLKVIDAKRW